MTNDIAKTGRKIIKKIDKQPSIVDFVLVFDKSGSMKGSEPYVNEGYSNILKLSSDLKDNIRLTTILFDGMIDISCERTNMSEAKSIKYKIGGSTSMNDAIGSAVNYIEECHKNEKIEFEEKEIEKSMIKRDYQICEYVKPNVHILIYSDGEENSSSIYNIDDIKTLIHTNVKNNNYTFYYCGDYNIDANAVAEKYGIPEHLVGSYTFSEGGFKAFFRMIKRLVSELAENGRLLVEWKELTKGASPLEGITDQHVHDIFNKARKLLRTNEDIFSKLEIDAINIGYNDVDFKKQFSDIMMNTGEIKKINASLEENGYIKLSDILNGYIKKQENQSEYIYSIAITHSIQSLLSVNLVLLSQLENITVESLYNLEKLYMSIVENLDKIEIYTTKAGTKGFTSLENSSKNSMKDQTNRLNTILYHIFKSRRKIIKRVISQANYFSLKIISENVPNPINLWFKKIFKTIEFSQEGYLQSMNTIQESIERYSLSKTLRRVLMNSNPTLNEYINDDFKFKEWIEVTKNINKEIL